MASSSLQPWDVCQGSGTLQEATATTTVAAATEDGLSAAEVAEAHKQLSARRSLTVTSKVDEKTGEIQG